MITSKTSKESTEETLELLRRVSRIELRIRSFVREFFAGDYHSAFKGRGIDFAGVRPYMPGDEIRAIDWNVTARYNEPYIKEYTEERELRVIFLIDVSASGNFGSRDRSKRELATEIAASLMFAAVQNGDRVGALMFSDQIEAYLPPKKGRRRALRIVRDILCHEPKSQKTDIALALNYLHRIAPRRCVIFLVSDLMAPDFSTQLGATCRRHDLTVIQLIDPLEKKLPSVGRVMFEDAETGEQILVDTTDPNFRQAYGERAQQLQEDTAQLLRAKKADHITINTESDYRVELQRFFHARSRRAARLAAK